MSELITEGNIRKQTVLEAHSSLGVMRASARSAYLKEYLLALVAIGMSLSGISQELKLKRAQ